MEITGDTLLGMAFSLWAIVVAVLGWGFRRDFRDIKDGVNSVRTDRKGDSERFNQYIVKTEARLAVLERDMDHVNHNKP